METRNDLLPGHTVFVRRDRGRWERKTLAAVSATTVAIEGCGGRLVDVDLADVRLDDPRDVKNPLLGARPTVVRSVPRPRAQCARQTAGTA